jgi:uroporphyrin-III C-methyltransferase/precorrin-2 dehydrogenase/sirohydrochlorin ferrochelatase
MSARPALAASIYVKDRSCLVVGTGGEAIARSRLLEAGGARVRTVAAADYGASDVDGAFLVLCLDATAGEAVSRDARRAGALVWVEDRPALSDFAMPALARRGAVSIAVATDGLAPALARRLRQELQRLLDEAGPALDGFVAILTSARAAAPAQERKQALRTLAEGVRIEGRIRIPTPR